MARLTRLVCAADPGGSTEAIAAVVEAAERDDAQAIAVVGNLGAGSASPQSQRAVFRALAAARRPVFWVPGPDDAIAELIGTLRPRVVVCGGAPMSELLGRSLIVAPGRASDGHYAVVDLHSREARLAELQAAR